jgi:hypothetical protein
VRCTDSPEEEEDSALGTRTELRERDTEVEVERR